MKKILCEFYPFEKEYFSRLWKEAIIISDANILLNLYYYSRKTSKELISILDKFSERLWIPYQIALEYQKNRLSKIRVQKESYNSLRKSIQDEINAIKKRLDDKYSKHPLLEVSKIKIILDKSFKDIEQYLNDTRDNHPDWEKNDEIRNDLDKLFEDKVSMPYSRDRLKEIYEIGYYRYENKIPPGFGDDKKDKERKYGDLIIWLDIIEKAKKEKKSVIFINDEKKEDWWQKDNNNLIPRYELIGEIKNEANASFYMYSAEDFMKYSYKFLNQTPKISVINEVRTFREFANFLENVKLQNEALARIGTIASIPLIDSSLAEAITRIGTIASIPLIDSSLAEAITRIPKTSSIISKSFPKNNIKTNRLIEDNKNTNKTIEKNKNSNKKEK